MAKSPNYEAGDGFGGDTKSSNRASLSLAGEVYSKVAKMLYVHDNVLLITNLVVDDANPTLSTRVIGNTLDLIGQ